MDHSLNHRIISRPYPVFWAGFRSTTTAMQQCGWQLSAEQDWARDSVRIAFEHRDARLYGISESVRLRQGYGRPSYDDERIEFHVRYIASDFIVQTMDNLSAFEPIDARSQIATVGKSMSIKDYNIFAAPLVRTEEIIVAPQDVQSLLDRIREIQVPEQAALREKQRLRASREGLMEPPGPQQKFHAQILSIADYREAA